MGAVPTCGNGGALAMRPYAACLDLSSGARGGDVVVNAAGRATRDRITTLVEDIG